MSPIYFQSLKTKRKTNGNICSQLVSKGPCPLRFFFLSYFSKRIKDQTFNENNSPPPLSFRFILSPFWRLNNVLTSLIVTERAKGIPPRTGTCWGVWRETPTRLKVGTRFHDPSIFLMPVSLLGNTADPLICLDNDLMLTQDDVLIWSFRLLAQVGICDFHLDVLLFVAVTLDGFEGQQVLNWHLLCLIVVRQWRLCISLHSHQCTDLFPTSVGKDCRLATQFLWASFPRLNTIPLLASFPTVLFLPLRNIPH